MAARKSRKTAGGLRAVIYARFSCDKQRDESIDDQVDACTKHCISMGYEVVGKYTDEAMSGRSDDRPNFLQMIEDASKGLFDIIMVWKMDRFARNMQDQYYYEKVLAGYGVRFESMMENIAGNGIEATMSKGMFAMFAQVRSYQTGVDTMRGMLGKAQKCQWLGDVLYGYRREGDSIVVNRDEAEVVIRAHNDFLWGKPIAEIVAWMREEGVRTPRGSRPSCNWVNAMLRNEKYAGIYKWGYEKDAFGNPRLDDQGKKIPLVYIEGGLPALVSAEEKQSCIRKLDFKRRVNSNSEYLLTGVLYCSECGKPMHGEACRSRNGSTYRYYNCYKKRKACMGAYNVDKVDHAVAAGVRRLLEDKELCDRLAERYMDWYEKKRGKAPKPQSYDRELRDVAKQRDNLMQAIADGMPYVAAKDMLESLAQQESSLMAKKERAERNAPARSKEVVSRFFSMLSSGTRTDKEIIQAFINSAWIYGEKVVAVMNFDGEETPQYEIDLIMRHEPPGHGAVRVESVWLPG